MTDVPVQSGRPSRLRNFFKLLGPGLVTGASDDDPSGIATYAQAGAQYGLGLSWTLLFTYPLMSVTQEISARIGRTTGRGLAGNMLRHTPRWLLYLVVILLIFANVINIAADLSAIGAAIQLVVPGPAVLFVVPVAAASLAAQILIGYERYARILKWLTLSLLAYVAVVLVVGVPWLEVGKSLIFPQHLGADQITMIVAIFGTTISPYLFFWQAEEEVEEQVSGGERPLRESPAKAEPEFQRIRLDTYLGMGLSNIVALFILLTAAATLHANGVTNIGSAAEAAQALRPIAGDFAFLVFALGIVGTGLLAIPVLAGAAAYALGEARRWPVGLGKPWHRAKRFYGALAVAMVLATILGTVVPIDPMKALVWSAVINGVLAAPVMAIMLYLGSRRSVMGRFVLSLPLRVVGWLATTVMMLAAVLMLML